MKKIILVTIILVIAVGAVFLLRNIRNEAVGPAAATGLIIGSNAIYVDDQLPGKRAIIAMVTLARSGFVVIHEDNNGEPGKLIGTSDVLSKGKTNSVTPIGLSRITEDGEMLYAMLYIDNGDGKFSSVNDKPALDSVSGQSVMMIFSVTLDAGKAGDINP